MEFNVLSTQNWSRTFNIWIEDIQVRFQPVVDLERALIHGGFLRRVRSLTRGSAALVAIFFTIHCTSPRISSPSPHPAPVSVGGFTYPGYFEVGEASWYGSEDDGFAGRSTASGELFDPESLTCAHRTLPLGSLVEVENLGNGRKVRLRVNDRGPFTRGRIMDTSRKAAQDLGFIGKGVARIKLRLVNSDGSAAILDPSLDREDPFTVQVAALSEPVNIQRLTRDLQDLFGPVSLQEVRTAGGLSMKRVRVGTFSRLEDAQKAAEEIAKRFGDRGVDPFITRRR